MKKLISVIVLLVAVTPAFAASTDAHPKYLKRDASGGYDVTYSYDDNAKSGWYGTVRAELNFLNWTNKYYVEGEHIGDDDYSFETLFGLDVAFGTRFDYFWRGEVEVGYVSEFSDQDEGYAFTLKIPYVMANGYYDFSNGFYAGAGLGLAFPSTELTDDAFVSGNGRKVGVAPMFALMGGYTYRLNNNFLLDLRYRLAGTWGPDLERQWRPTVIPAALANKHLKNEIGFIMDNSISVGLRYEF